MLTNTFLERKKIYVSYINNKLAKELKNIIKI